MAARPLSCSGYRRGSAAAGPRAPPWRPPGRRAGGGVDTESDETKRPGAAGSESAATVTAARDSDSGDGLSDSDPGLPGSRFKLDHGGSLPVGTGAGSDGCQPAGGAGTASD